MNMSNKNNETKNISSTPKRTTEEKKEVAVAKQKISRNKILIGSAIVVVLILLGFYIYQWQKVKNQEKYMNSYLLDSGTVSLEIKNLDEVSQILTESPNEYFVLITYTGDKETYELEEDIKSIIDDYKLSDAFYYLNIKNLLKEDNYLNRLNNAFNTDKITAVPIILYYKDDVLIDTVSRVDDNIINAGDFQKILDIYEYEGQ